MSEEKRIMDFFGFGQTEGEIRGEHFTAILTFLKTNSGKSWKFVKNVSPLYVHMHFRYILEGYINGLIELGIIEFFSINNNTYYRWIGEKAINGLDLGLNEIAPPKPKEIKTKKGTCKNCGKETPKNKIYCDEKCLREYMKKKKEKK